MPSGRGDKHAELRQAAKHGQRSPDWRLVGQAEMGEPLERRAEEKWTPLPNDFARRHVR
jgi:hypothetical protein